jgi:hypothetical protein
MTDVEVESPPPRKLPAKRRSSYTSPKVQGNAFNTAMRVLNNKVVRLVITLGYVILCIVYYKNAENWDVLDSVLFVLVTVNTVGYGNLHPTSDNSRVFTIFLMVLGVIVVFAWVSNYLREGVIQMNKFLARRLTGQLKRAEVLFQRRAMLSVLWVVMCALFGALVFQGLEGWTYITAMYFVIQTMMVSVQRYRPLCNLTPYCFRFTDCRVWRH